MRYQRGRAGSGQWCSVRCPPVRRSEQSGRDVALDTEPAGVATPLCCGRRKPRVNGPSYRDAGVDLDAYADAMRRLPDVLRSTHDGRVLPLPGGFAGLYRLFDQRHTYRDPVLVSGADGVGTKIKVAQRAGAFDTVGIDLVAMCVNDCLCLGAEPLFFLDYLALDRDRPDVVERLVRGVAAGCREAGAALLGGETAIMPDVYAEGEFDMAGFCVAVVERDGIVDGTRIRSGDRVLGLASSGFHSNGYSLIRRIVFAQAGMSIDSPVPDLGASVGEVLLRPTRIYVGPVLEILGQHRDAVHGMAHITGGGLQENIARILPPNVDVVLRGTAWNVPAEFRWLQQLGGVAEPEMWRVFNMGIGFCIIAASDAAGDLTAVLQSRGVDARVIGEVTAGEGRVRIVES
ncbi:MAG: phosphoribosylformylglycinamidine cyclo-ligase [Planctomycetota bacterium]|nr:MAG: phosphoribosylformylglycinamidine cyclo-ligase [Planctomycetota bacterium]